MLQGSAHPAAFVAHTAGWLRRPPRPSYVRLAHLPLPQMPTLPPPPPPSLCGPALAPAPAPCLAPVRFRGGGHVQSDGSSCSMETTAAAAPCVAVWHGCCLQFSPLGPNCRAWVTPSPLPVCYLQWLPASLSPSPSPARQCRAIPQRPSPVSISAHRQEGRAGGACLAGGGSAIASQSALWLAACCCDGLESSHGVHGVQARAHASRAHAQRPKPISCPALPPCRSRLRQSTCPAPARPSASRRT